MGNPAIGWFVVWAELSWAVVYDAIYFLAGKLRHNGQCWNIDIDNASALYWRGRLCVELTRPNCDSIELGMRRKTLAHPCRVGYPPAREMELSSGVVKGHRCASMFAL